MIEKLSSIIKKNRILAKKIFSENNRSIEIEKSLLFPEKSSKEAHIDDCEIDNKFIQGDNLDVLKLLLSGKKSSGIQSMKDKVKLIYIDPPFYSKSDYKINIKLGDESKAESFKVEHTVYTDTWENGMEDYLNMLCLRLLLMKELLSEDGSVFVHLDWHVVHYVKIIMDAIFGSENFANEIIWQYKSGGVSKKNFARKHDTILFYGKTDKRYFNPQKEKSYNRQFKPYRFKGVKEYEDDLGWYTLVNMKDVWSIDMVGRTSKERVGYATQKPKAILERMVESCTEEGDLVADFFAGSGVLADVAENMNRKWICADIEKTSALVLQNRLYKNGKDPCEILKLYFEEQIKFENFAVVKLLLEKQNDLTKINIEKYAIKGDNILKNKKEQAKLDEILKGDGLELIDTIIIDDRYDGKCFKGSYVFTKNKYNHIKYTDIVFKNRADNHKIGIKIIDVFGNESFKELESI